MHKATQSLKLYSILFEQVLNDLLVAVDVSQQEMEDFGNKPFASGTTLDALRLTINSIIGLTEDLLKEGYSFVLTGKFNQDCTEVIKGFLFKHVMNNDY